MSSQNVKITVHGDSFEPPETRGRARKYPIHELLVHLDRDGLWCSVNLTTKDAGSVIRQLKKYGDIEVRSVKDFEKDQHRTVYFRIR